MTRDEKLHKLADSLWEIAKRKEDDYALSQAVVALKDLSSAIHQLAENDKLRLYIEIK